MNDGIMNNKYLVAFMFLELEFMKHVEKVGDNRDIVLLKTMSRKLNQLPTFAYHNLVTWVDSAMLGEYPAGNLDTTQKARLMYYIELLGYNLLHEIARNCVYEWKYLLAEHIEDIKKQEIAIAKMNALEKNNGGD